MRAAVLTGPGALDPALRQAAASGAGVPAELRTYVDKVHRHAYRVADALDFAVPPEAVFDRGARLMLKRRRLQP